MRTRSIIILLICILLLSGCSNSKINNLKENHIMKNVTTNSSEELAIYQINSDVFDNLLESNSFESIKNISSAHYSYPQDGVNYITYNSVLFEITEDFVNMVNNKTIFEECFLESNNDEKIECLAVFEAPYVPLSIWIKTNEDTYFLTVNEEYNNGYHFYSQSDYIEKYKSQKFLLKINDNVSSNIQYVKAYYEHAELPLLEILSSVGAEIKWKNENKVNILLNKNTYILDLQNNQFYKKHNKKNNLFSGCNGGGPYRMYLSDDEYYVDSDTLQCVMLELGQKINIEYNTEQKFISITTQ